MILIILTVENVTFLIFSLLVVVEVVELSLRLFNFVKCFFNLIVSFKDKVFIELRSQTLVVKVVLAVQQGILAVMLFDKFHEFLKTGLQEVTFYQAVAGLLNIYHGHQVLLALVYVLAEDGKLLFGGSVTSEKMVAAHLQACGTCFTQVLLVFGVHYRETFGGLDVHEFDVLVLGYLLPVDVAIVLGHVDAVVLGIAAVAGEEDVLHVGHQKVTHEQHKCADDPRTALAPCLEPPGA